MVLLIVCGLAALGHGGVLAIMILTGAVVGTATAWGAFGNRPTKAMASPGKLEELEERLANVETIVSYEEKIVEGKLRNLESRSELT